MPYCAEPLEVGTKLMEVGSRLVWKVTGRGVVKEGRIFRGGEFLASPFTFNIESPQGQRIEINSCDIGDESHFRFVLAKIKV